MHKRHRTPPRLSLLVGGAFWMLTLLYFVGQLVAQTAWRTPYSLIDNRVSDLGNTECGRTLADTYICSPLHAVMNATFVLTGVLILIGLFLTRRVWPRRRLTTWGFGSTGTRRSGHHSGRTKPRECQCFVPPDWRTEHPGRQCSDDLARSGCLARSQQAGLVLCAIRCDRVSWAAGRASPRDLDRSCRWTRRTPRALSTDHLADRFRISHPC